MSGLFRFQTIVVAGLLTVGNVAISSTEDNELAVVNVTPSGDEVPITRGEITIEFNKRMVPFGQTDKDLPTVPVQITPDLQCTWRWSSASELTCVLGESLKYTTSYVISIDSSLESMNGTRLGKGGEFTFRTASLGVRGQSDLWRNPTRPIFNLSFTQPIPLGTLLQKVQILDLRTSEHIEVKALRLADTPRDLDVDINYFRQEDDGSWGRASANDKRDLLQSLTDGGIDRARHAEGNREYASRKWLVESLKPLRPDTTYDLVVAEGVQSIFATEPTRRAMHVLRFKAFPEFEFLGLECIDTEGTFKQYLLKGIETHEEKLSGCDPDVGITLLFTAPVDAYTVKYRSPITPRSTAETNRASSRYFSRKRGEVVSVLRYWDNAEFATDDDLHKVKIGDVLQGNTTHKIHVGAAPIYDLFGRKLGSSRVVEFRTGHLKPRLDFESSRVVLLPDSNLTIPIEIANLRDLRVLLATKPPSRRGWAVNAKRQRFDTLSDQIVPAALNVEGRLSQQMGQFMALIRPQSESIYGKNPNPSCIFGQVTPYDVHALIGHTSSIAWVKDLQTGQVVPNALVSLGHANDSAASPIAEVRTDQQGIAQLPGRIHFSANDGTSRVRKWRDEFEAAGCHLHHDADYALRINAREGEAFLGLSGVFVEKYGFFPSTPKDVHLSVWGHSAQGLYRPGQVIQYKIFVREQTDSGLRIPRDRRFRLLALRGYSDLLYFEDDIKLNDFGTIHGQFKIPESSVRSLRFIVLIDDGESNPSLWDEDSGSLNYSDIDHWEAFDVDVVDFDPPSIRVEYSLDKEVYELGDELLFESRTDLLSGGPFTRAPVVLKLYLYSERFRSEHPETDDYVFLVETDRYHEWTIEHVRTSDSTTDSQGKFSASHVLDVRDIHYGRVSVEFGVQEDTGNIIWENARANYRSTNRFVGLRHDGERAHVGETVSFSTVVVDEKGEPQNDLPVKVKYFRVDRERSDAKTDGKLVHACEIATSHEPKVCTFVPSQAGFYQAIASMDMTDGRVQEVVTDVFVSGKINSNSETQREYVRIGNQRELEDRQFSAGEFASLVIEHTVPGSLALVTVERLGILDHWVMELSGSHDVIDIPIRQDYAPIVRARVTVATVNSITKPLVFVAADDQQRFPNSWTTDVRLRVKDPTRQLDVKVSTDREIYKPGDKVKVSVSVNEHSSTRSPRLAELAVAVVDRGVIEASREGIKHFDPIRGLLESRAMDIQRYSLLSTGAFSVMHVTGNYVHDDDLRTNEELTSLWLPQLTTSDDGLASFEFEVGDRLTEWEIIAIAASSTDQFGFGKKSIKTNLGIEIHPVLPNLVTDEDVFDAGFSILNRTDKEREVAITIQADGDVERYADTETIVLAPFERELVTTRTRARLEQRLQSESRGTIRFFVTASSDELSDVLVQEVPVFPRSRFLVSSIYGTSVQANVSERIEFPTDIKDRSGSLSVRVSPSLISAVEDRVAQVRDYPYQCWEQRLSSAVVAAQYARLSERMNVDWKDASQYIRDVLQSAVDYQSRSGGFGYWTGARDHHDLYLSAYTALAFKWLSDAGYQINEFVLRELLRYLETYTVYRLPDYLSLDKTSVSSLRLMLANALVQHGKGDLELVKKLYEENLNPNLFAIAQTLEAAVTLDAPSEMLTLLTTRLNNSVGESGDRAVVNHGVDSRSNFMHSSTLKTTCSAISAFVRANSQGMNLVSEEMLAKLVRGAMFAWNHQNLGANPHQSSFCLSAIREYVENMETSTDEFTSEVELALDKYLNRVQFERLTEHNTTANSYTFTTSLKPDYLGEPAELLVRQGGNSRFYYKATLQYESTEIQHERENFGIDVRKTYWVENDGQWVELDNSAELRRGDVVHVGLTLDIRDQRNFVIVDDPVPGFLQPININLAKTNVRELTPTLNESLMGDPVDLEQDFGIPVLGISRWSFYNSEIRNHNVRFMSDFLPSGQYRLFWSGRVISTGDFLARPAHAEAMYAPEIYGNTQVHRIRIASE